MARKFVSPGVFTAELDQSYLAAGVADIGAAVVGRTVKGPAFVPTKVYGYSDFVSKFGDVDTSLQMPYAAKNYLKNGSVLTVVRVLGSRDGSTIVTNGSSANVYGITGSLSSSTGIVTGSVLAFVHVPTAYTASMSGTGTGSAFSFLFTGSFGGFAGTASFVTTSPDYIGKVFNTDPTKVTTYGHYLFKNFQWGPTAGTVTVAAGTVYSSGTLTTAVSYDYDYNNPSSPMIKSQPFGSNQYSLFNFEALSSGEAANTDVKVSIINIKPSINSVVTSYGSFDVLVRNFSDTDNRMEQVETFTACDLDPTSANYIARRIGDQHSEWNSTTRKNTISGQFKNASKYIRVVMGTADYDATSLPWGHAGYPENTVAGGNIVDVPYVASNLDNAGNFENSNIWGLDFTKSGVADRLKALASPGTQVAGTEFSLTHISASITGGTNFASYNAAHTSTIPSALSGTADTAARNGFSVAFFGGFDGWNMTAVDPYTATIGTTAQKAALDTLSNPDEIDMNVLAVPGTTTAAVTDYARQICNDRADCIAIIDIPGSSVNDTIGQINARGVDDNYCAAYYPNLKYADTTNNAIVEVSPSVAVLAAFAFSDRVGQVFFAPAGLNRGGLSQFGIVDVADRLTFQDRNDLYEARVNPIAVFPNEGINIWGQKTLQARPSALDRVNVRRLLIYSKKTIASAARYLLFEPNNPSTWQRFLNTVNPILEKVRLNQGLERFKVVMDSTVNTPDMIDRNIMVGKIFLQPTKSAEYIDLSFTISASGVEFGE